MDEKRLKYLKIVASGYTEYEYEILNETKLDEKEKLDKILKDGSTDKWLLEIIKYKKWEDSDDFWLYIKYSDTEIKINDKGNKSYNIEIMRDNFKDGMMTVRTYKTIEIKNEKIIRLIDKFKQQ